MRKDEQKILTIFVTGFLILEFVVICFFVFLHYKKYHYTDKGRVVAEIYNEKIYSKEIESRLNFLSNAFNNESLTPEDLDKEMLKAILLEQYINKKIIELAKKNKTYINDDFNFKAREYYNNLVREQYLKDNVFNLLEDEHVLKDKYDKLMELAKGKEERKISHILVETEDEINRIRNTILRKNNFEFMAKTRSLDTATAINGGSLGYVVKEELVYPEFSNVAFLLKLGELSKPIQTKEGWHIIKVEDIRDIKVKTFEESKKDIYESLRQEKFDEFVDSIIDVDNIDNNMKIFIKTNDKNYNKEKIIITKEEEQDNESNKKPEENIVLEEKDSIDEYLDNKNISDIIIEDDIVDYE